MARDSLPFIAWRHHKDWWGNAGSGVRRSIQPSAAVWQLLPEARAALQTHQQHRHVIGGAGCERGVDQRRRRRVRRACLLRRRVGRFKHDRRGVVVREHVPHAVAREQQPLIRRAQIHRAGRRLGAHVGRECEVPESAGDGQHSIHARHAVFGPEH